MRDSRERFNLNLSLGEADNLTTEDAEDTEEINIISACVSSVSSVSSVVNLVLSLIHLHIEPLPNSQPGCAPALKRLSYKKVWSLESRVGSQKKELFFDSRL
jgi:hypothetical protein